jgi:hypothetical protein
MFAPLGGPDRAPDLGGCAPPAVISRQETRRAPPRLEAIVKFVEARSAAYQAAGYGFAAIYRVD